MTCKLESILDPDPFRNFENFSLKPPRLMKIFMTYKSGSLELYVFKFYTVKILSLNFRLVLPTLKRSKPKYPIFNIQNFSNSSDWAKIIKFRRGFFHILDYVILSEKKEFFIICQSPGSIPVISKNLKKSEQSK